MKDIKKERSISREESKDSGLFSLTKGTLFAYIITMLVFIIYGVLLTYTDITEKNIQMVVMITTVLSVLVSGFISSRGVSSKGLVFGMIAGGLYAFIMIMISFCILPNIQISSKSAMITILSISGGGVGGIIGINSKK